LYAAEQLLAVTILLRSHQFAHGWFMAFDPQYARYSPGTLLMHELLRAVPERGIARIDMGRGAHGYKLRFMNGTSIVREGIVASRFSSRVAWTQWQHLRNWLRQSRLRPIAHRANRVLSNVRWYLGSNY
jgi:CelD/BcsL family acetyltransferase involved in cellulose biosynthesis